MSDTWAILLLYGTPLFAAWLIYARRRSRQAEQNSAILSNSIEQNLMQPASLHPKINPGKCIGSGACVDACPEKNVLGMIAGRAQLITPANCIGHGACLIACPVDAIDLVIGTQQRGIEIPFVSPDFETNVPGIFVAGELGGMGLIRNGIEQGRQAIDSIRSKIKLGKSAGSDVFDVIIVGAGPAGLAASLSAKQHGLKFRTVEQESLGGTVAHYPRGKVVMTAPVDLPGYGKVKLRETTKEALLELWTDVIDRTNVQINYGERVEAIDRLEGQFTVRTDQGTYSAKTVLLAVGRRGTPRKLDVPGEHMEKVLYRLVNPDQYEGMNVLVVGGGDSALEAAEGIAAVAGTHVTLSYRSESFSRAKPANRERVEAAATRGSLDIRLESTVVEIRERTVLLQLRDEKREIENDAVIVCAGGILPTAFLRSVGIKVETRHGEVSP
jgi:thioredoxin reductase (NADPH)